jgi:hypothetical protein
MRLYMLQAWISFLSGASLWVEGMTSQATNVIRTSSITADFTANGLLIMKPPTSFNKPREWLLDHGIGFVLTLILAQASVMYTCYWAGHTEGVRDSGGFLTEFPYTLIGLHIAISFCLTVCAAGLWLRRVWGLVISMLALLSVLVTYGYWHFTTVKYLRELQNDMVLYKRVQQNVGWFHGATKWDFVVLVLVVILLLWHVVRLSKMMRSRALVRRVGSIGTAGGPGFLL